MESTARSQIRNGLGSDWYLDSGASRHVTGHKNLLKDLKVGNQSQIRTAGGESLRVEAKGKTIVSTKSGGIKFDNILYVPGITKNLLSVGAITDGKARMKVLFDSDRFWILQNFPDPEPNHVVATGSRDRKNGLYRFESSHDTVNSIIKTTTSTQETPTADGTEFTAPTVRGVLVSETVEPERISPVTRAGAIHSALARSTRSCQLESPHLHEDPQQGDRIESPGLTSSFLCSMSHR